MSLFSSILDKLGIGGGTAATHQPSPTPSASSKPATSLPETPPPRTGAAASTGGTGATANVTMAGGTAASAAQTSAPRTATPVDVSALLEKRASASSQKLNWRTSIVDLLKLLDIDSSLEARKQLATELSCPPELMNDSAKMNTWLHKAVLSRVAANGGAVPKELLD